MSNNPKCPYCGGEMEMRFRHRPDGTIWKGVVDPREIPYDAVVTYVDDNYHYYCRNCKVNTPYRNTREEAYAAAMKRCRAKGEWKEYGDYNGMEYEVWYHTCSACGEVGIPTFNFCPNCGADMRKEVNDER